METTPCSLDLHTPCGSQLTTLDNLAHIPTPPDTSTHKLIPHQDLFHMVEASAQNHGLEIVQSKHAVKDGLYFAMIELKSGDNHPDFSSVIGLRNSHNKKMPAALVCGTGVFVCDNLYFSGEIKIGRRHTKRMMDDLPLLVDQAMDKLVSTENQESGRIDKYKGYDVDETAVNSILIRTLDNGVISGGKIPRVLQEWREPQHKEFEDRTMWSLLNAYTEVLKPRVDGFDVFHLSDKTYKLLGVMDREVN